MIDLPDDMNAEVYSSEYRWAECSDCGASLRAPVYDPDPVMCSHCADPYPTPPATTSDGGRDG